MRNKDGKRVWHTKEWKELRDKLIKDKCEQCGSTEKLTLHHIWQPPSMGALECSIAKTMFNYWFHNMDSDALGRYSKMAQEAVGQSLNDDTLTREEKTSLQKQWEISRDECVSDFAFNEFRKDKKEEIHAKVVEQNKEDFKRYMSGKDTVTFCNKCAFLWDEKGQKLCPKCKKHHYDIKTGMCAICSGMKKLCVKCNKNYHYILYPTCFDCSPRNQKMRKFMELTAGSQEENEIVECLDDCLEEGCNHIPECPFVDYSFDGGGRGIMYKCCVEKAIKKYPNAIKIND